MKNKKGKVYGLTVLVNRGNSDIKGVVSTDLDPMTFNDFLHDYSKLTARLQTKMTAKYENTDVEARGTTLHFLPADEVTAGTNTPNHTPTKLAESVGFGRAIETLKSGGRAARNGWNGKGMYLYLVRSESVSIKGMASTDILDAIYMRTADGKNVPWLASQTDLLAEDWFLMGYGNVQKEKSYTDELIEDFGNYIKSEEDDLNRGGYFGFTFKSRVKGAEQALKNAIAHFYGKGISMEIFACDRNPKDYTYIASVTVRKRK